MKRLNAWIERFGMRPVGVPRWVEHHRICPLGVPLRDEGCGQWLVPDAERGLHASGHATGPELLKMVRDINPQTFIPVHSRRPELYRERLQGTGIEVYLPTLGKELPL